MKRDKAASTMLSPARVNGQGYLSIYGPFPRARLPHNDIIAFLGFEWRTVAAVFHLQVANHGHYWFSLGTCKFAGSQRESRPRNNPPSPARAICSRVAPPPRVVMAGDKHGALALGIFLLRLGRTARFPDHTDRGNDDRSPLRSNGRSVFPNPGMISAC